MWIEAAKGRYGDDTLEMWVKRKYFLRGLKYVVGIITVVYLIFCTAMRLDERENTMTEGDYRLYYVVNTDGMKGLGHSLLLLVDAEGNGTVLSFNGMQRSLTEALLGSAGVGKMSEGFMDVSQVEAFLASGNLALQGDQLQDNYDWALYRNISEQEYNKILDKAQLYIETGDTYEWLYAEYIKAQDTQEARKYFQQMEDMAKDETLPLYQIYMHNCDTAARILIATVDEEMAVYNDKSVPLTPNGNMKAFAKKADRWNVMQLGNDSFAEDLLGFFIIF